MPIYSSLSSRAKLSQSEQIVRDCIIFYVNGNRRELRGAAVFQPLSTYLRQDLGLTGTKVVCSEGDCGSCTVLRGRPQNGVIEYRSLCSCIQFVFQADGCHIVTVEGLNSGDRLDPVQDALVRHHGTQCGFCTPGIVMSIHALLETDPVLSEQRLRQGLVGNLCRCTGYDPILRAGLAVNTQRATRMSELFNSPDIMEELTTTAQEPVYLELEGKVFFKPSAIDEASRFRATHQDCLIISGGTDLGVQVNKGSREITTVLSTAGLSALTELVVTEDEIIAGVNVSLSALEAETTRSFPELASLLARFGSPQVKNAATLGGNIANASPVADTLPALFVMNARIELTGAHGSRQVNINDFYIGYKKTVATTDELISRIWIPRLCNGEILKIYKVSRRQDLDISSFSAAVWLKLSCQTIQDARIAYGGVAPTIVRLPQTEAHLKGRDISLETFEAAGGIALSEIAPIGDVRGSMQYRNALATNILRKLYHDLKKEQAQPATV